MGDFVLVIYNPASKQRREDLLSALDLLKGLRGEKTIAIIATNVGRAQEKITVTTLAELNPELVTMQSLLIIGSSHTKKLGKFIYTPRFYQSTP